MFHNKNIIALYHADCPDGFGAAYVLWKKFGDQAEYIPMYHHAPLPEMKGKKVYLLDLSYELSILQKIAADNELIIIDHHISREKETKAMPNHIYALDKSGTGLAWQHLFPDKPLPYLLQLIQDEDLWQFKIPDIKEVLLVFQMQPYDFEVWDKAVAALENEAVRKQYIAEGAVMLVYRDYVIKRILRNTNYVMFEGYKTIAVNSSAFASEIGNIISGELTPPIGIVWAVRKDRIAVSLRSNGSVNVGELAARHGGGGHNGAAAFTLPIGAPLPWEYIKE